MFNVKTGFVFAFIFSMFISGCGFKVVRETDGPTKLHPVLQGILDQKVQGIRVELAKNPDPSVVGESVALTCYNLRNKTADTKDREIRVQADLFQEICNKTLQAEVTAFERAVTANMDASRPRVMPKPVGMTRLVVKETSDGDGKAPSAYPYHNDHSDRPAQPSRPTDPQVSRTRFIPGQTLTVWTHEPSSQAACSGRSWSLCWGVEIDLSGIRRAHQLGGDVKFTVLVNGVPAVLADDVSGGTVINSVPAYLDGNGQPYGKVWLLGQSERVVYVPGVRPGTRAKTIQLVALVREGNVYRALGPGITYAPNGYTGAAPHPLLWRQGLNHLLDGF